MIIGSHMFVMPWNSLSDGTYILLKVLYMILAKVSTVEETSSGPMAKAPRSYFQEIIPDLYIH